MTDIVQQILSDPLSLPPEFTSAIPQIVAQNSVATNDKGIVIYAQTTASVTATGTTFAAGTDLLSSPLSFSDTGSNRYLLSVRAEAWNNSGLGNVNFLHLNLDGAEAGLMGGLTTAVAAGGTTCSFDTTFQVAPGSHTVNARLRVNAGTATVNGGTGGAGSVTPIFVGLYRI